MAPKASPRSGARRAKPTYFRHCEERSIRDEVEELEDGAEGDTAQRGEEQS